MRNFGVVLVILAMLLVSVVPALAQDGQDIVDIAVNDGRFTTLVAAVQAAGLVDTLKSEGPFTVFAPTDEAFGAALSALNIEASALLADTELLTNILLYHVVAGAVTAEQVVGLDSFTTVQGSDVSVAVRDGKVYLNNDVEVIITDIAASNGIIHVIDFVLLPPAEEAAQASNTIVDIAVNDGRFTTLVAAVQAAGLVDALASEGPFTVFAPTDDAFAAAFAALGIEPAALLADTETLTDILLYHVAAGSALAEDVVGLDSVETLNGLNIDITVNEAGVFLNETTQVIITDIVADNGVIHVIDSVLLPPFSVTNNRIDALNFRAGPGLDEPIIGAFPVNARAEAVARNEAGDWVQIKLNGELGWVFAPLTTYAGDLMSLPVAAPNIVEIAVTDGRFTTLVAAVQAAGLAETLASEGPFTVFAPTDDAFAAAFAALGIEPAALLEDTATLTNVLLYHVVSGKAMAADVVGLSSVTTVQGEDISIMVNDSGVFLNDSVQVIITDIEASNGVIHVIDFVLLPPSMMAAGEAALGTIPEVAAAAGSFNTLLAAVEAAGLGEALSAEGPYTVFAPTDDAFAAAFAALGIEPAALLADTETLTSILLYHVVGAEALAADVVGLSSVTTLQGADVSITVNDSGVFLNDSIQVIMTDVMADNGVIHVIDGVLLPPAE